MLAVPQREGEIAIQSRDPVQAVDEIGCEDHLSVRAGTEPIALGLELLPQLDIVEDLAIKRDDGAALAVGHRLGTSRQVDDAQAGMGEAAASVEDLRSGGVGAAMRKGVGHCA